MKKMVCEICGSHSIRKEDGVFVCKECGTEYSVYEAKKLLQDIGDENNISNVIKEVNTQKSNEDNKDKLISLLSYWALNLSKIPDLKTWFGYDKPSLNTDEVWNTFIPNIVNFKEEKKFPKIDYNKILFYDVPVKQDRLLNEGNNCLAKRFYNSNFLHEVLENELTQLPSYKKITTFFSTYGNTYCYLWQSMERKLNSCFPTFYILISNAYYQFEMNHKSAPQLYSVERGFFGAKKKLAPLSVQDQFNAMLGKTARTVNEFVNEHNKLMDYYDSKYEEVCLIVKEIAENCKELEKELYLPIKYRSLSIIFTLIDLLKDGKANNWTDLINLYDTHQYRAGVYERLDAISSNLRSINETLVTGFTVVVQNLNNIQNRLNLIDKKMSIITNDVSNIRRDTFITMWNSL